MIDTSIYRDVAARTDGAFLLGVVGPVRTGKSSFIKRFMETLVIPGIENPYMRERARDELPQSGSGKTIMTAEPKFVPEDAVTVHMPDQTEFSLRMVDCVGYMVEGAAGQFEDGEERQVSTPWFDHEVSMTDAAEKGTHQVIAEHSTIGIVVTTDGTICDIPRERYLPAEERVIRELKDIGKPFIVLLNSAFPESETARAAAEEIRSRYDVPCLRVNCLTLGEEEILQILQCILREFPLKSVGIFLPEWISALGKDDALKQELYERTREAFAGAETIRDCTAAAAQLGQWEAISAAESTGQNLGEGAVSLELRLPRALYYDTISRETGLDIRNDGDLMTILKDMSEIKNDYDRLRGALEDVRSSGYGVVMPSSAQMTLEEPQIIRQGGEYSVRMKASAPAIHMLMTNVETEVTPAIGGETASEEILNFLLQGFDGDVNKIWQSNIFGKSLNDIAEEGLSAKILSLPEQTKAKLQETLQRILNEGSGGLICILL